MTRRAVRLATVGFAVLFTAGLAIMLVGGALAGDWYALRLPWSDLGMVLITFGLAGAFISVAAEDLIEPIGRWRLLGLPGIAVGAWFWFILLVFGQASTGRGPRTPSPVSTLLYSAPQYIAILAIAVLLAAVPLLVVRPWEQRER